MPDAVQCLLAAFAATVRDSDGVRNSLGTLFGDADRCQAIGHHVA
jgi:hypothetical protein